MGPYVYSGLRLLTYLKSKVRRQFHLRKFSDSQASSVYSFSRDAPLIVPLTAKAAEYSTDSSFSIKLGKIMLF